MKLTYKNNKLATIFLYPMLKIKKEYEAYFTRINNLDRILLDMVYRKFISSAKNN